MSDEETQTETHVETPGGTEVEETQTEPATDDGESDEG